MEKTNSLLEIGPVDIKDLKKYCSEIAEEQWEEWQYRQNTFRYVNYYTRTIPFLWSDSNNFKDTIVVQTMNKDTDLYNCIIPYCNFLENYYNGDVVKAILVKLKSNGRIAKHIDSYRILKDVYRCHLPVVTNDNVIFGIGENEYNLKEGILYEVNNRIEHYVNNNSNEDRIHLLIDILPKKLNVKVLMDI